MSEFRSRLVAGHAEQLLFETLLTQLKERGLVKAQGRQRTDATHVLAAIAPDEWYEVYGRRIEESQFPKNEASERLWSRMIGRDGSRLLNAIYSSPKLNWLSDLPLVETWRQVWVQQFARRGRPITLPF